MTKFKMYNWDESIIKVGKRNCPQCNAEMKYLGIEFEGEPNAHFWQCPVDDIEHGYVEELTEKDIALMEHHYSKQLKQYKVRLTVEVSVEATSRQEVARIFSKPCEGLLLNVLKDDSCQDVNVRQSISLDSRGE